MTKVLKNSKKMAGGREGEWQQYFDFSYITLDEKCLFKKLHLGLFFLFVCLKFRNS